MPKPARSKQPGRRATNEKFVRFEPDTFALLVALSERNQPESMNAIVNKAVREYCARELGDSAITRAIDVAKAEMRQQQEQDPTYELGPWNLNEDEDA